MKLNEETVKALPVPEGGNRITYFPDALLQGTRAPPGFGCRVTAGGARSFILNYRVNHVERRITIGQWPTWTVLKAVKEARKLRQRIDRGEDPLEDRRKQEASQRDTLAAVCDEYFQREGHKLRSRDERQRALTRLVLPEIGRKDIRAITRGDVVRLLDGVEDNSGPVMATRTLAYLGRVFSWFESRNDDFRSPIVRGMGRSNAKERARTRTLSDDELRAVWQAAGSSVAPYARMVRFILLTGARRAEAAEMVWSELDGDTWTLPAARNKVKQDLLRPLCSQAVAELPAKNGGKFVFSTDNGVTAIGSFSRYLADLQAASGTSKWSLHDLRRSARTLMSRAGVISDHAERCLGHVLPTIRGTYDRHEYFDEKQRAYELLAAQIERIVNPPPANVTLMKRGKAS